MRLLEVTSSKPSMRVLLRRQYPAHYQVASVAPANGWAYTHPFKQPIKVILIGFITACTVSACESAETEISDEQTHTITNIEENTLSKDNTTVASATPQHNHNAMSDEQASNHSSDVSQESAFTPEHQFTPEIVQPVQINTSASTAASRIVESLELSRAKLAANRHDKCPKLIVPRVDSNQIVRNDEIMKSDHCDYYLYPSQGQALYVSSYPNTTQATLIAPVVYDFDNGSYRTNSADKHVIRIAYTGSEYPLEPLNYNMVVTVE